MFTAALNSIDGKITIPFKAPGHDTLFCLSDASVSLAFLLWFSFAYPSERVYRSFDIPIEYSNL